MFEDGHQNLEVFLTFISHSYIITYPVICDTVIQGYQMGLKIVSFSFSAGIDLLWFQSLLTYVPTLIQILIFVWSEEYGSYFDTSADFNPFFLCTKVQDI